MTAESHTWVLASFIGTLISGSVLIIILILQFRRANAASSTSDQAQRQLRDAIESVSEGFALYDTDDRLVLSNTQSRDYYAGVEDKIVPGVTFEEIVRTAAERGLYGDGVSIEEAVKARMERHRNPSGPIDQQGMDGRWLLVNEQKTSDGGTVVVRTDVTHLKKVEHDLSAAEEKFRNLVEGSIEGIVIHREFDIVFANEAWAKMHGYNLEEAYGLNSIVDVVVPEHRDRVTQYKEARIRGEPAPTYYETYETESLRKDGSRIWVGVMVRLVDWDGEPAIQLTTIDLTEHKATEEKFRNLIEGSISGILIHRHFKPLFINQAWADMHGYTIDEIHAMDSVEQCFAPHEIERMTITKNARMRGEEVPSLYEYQARRKDGSLFWLENVSRNVNWDGEAAIQSTAIDVTERRAAGEELKAAEEKFRGLVEGSIEGIIVHSNLKPQFINHAWAKIHGYTLDEAYALDSIEVCFAPHERDRIRSYHDARIRGDFAPSSYEYEALRKDGSTIWLNTLARLVNWDGELAVKSTFIDVTELKAAEERFSKAFHASPDMIVISEPENGIIHDLNQRAIDLLGYTREEVVGRAAPDLKLWVNPGDYDRFLEALRDHKRVQDFEVRFKSKSGRILDLIVASEWIEIRGERRLLTTYRDLTESREAEKAHRAAEERFEKAFNSSPDLIAITAPNDGRLFDINETGLSLLGFEREEAVGNTVFALNIWADPKQRTRLLAELRRSQSVRDFETQLKSKSGQIFDVSISAEWLEIEGEDRILSVARNVTERKRSEAALHESEERFFKAFQASPNMIAIVGQKDGRLYDINENWLSILGYGRSEIVGHVNFDNAYWADQSRRTELYRSIAEENVIRNFEARLYTSDGEIRDYEFAAEGIELDGLPYSIVVGDDISERKRIDRLKNEFISTVSHELRTPLTSISGSLGLLTGGAAGDLSDKARQLIEIAESNSDRLVRLINDILDVEKIEAGRMEFDLQATELMPIIEAALAVNRPYGERHGVRFQIVGTLPDAMVCVDVDRFDQICANLLSNAAKFSPRDGVVEISVSRNDGMIRISVSDDGPGIPSEFQERIFEKFTQADTSDARHAPGSGLGLSIAKAIAEKMNGLIAFESEPGRGCTFFLDLPELKGERVNPQTATGSLKGAGTSLGGDVNAAE